MFETKNVHETCNELNVDPKKGLTSREAGERLVKHGLNKLEEKKKKSIFLVFLSNLNDPMIFILLAAAAINLGIFIFNTINNQEAEIIDTVIILAVVLINAIIGTIQESKAEKSLEALRRMSSPTCVVRRNGALVELKAEELVPGDIVILEEGRTVPADLRLIEAVNLKTDESSLTGESLPIEKDADIVFSEKVGVGDRVNVAYSSTPVVYGRGEGVVIATGMNTETGKIAKMLSSKEDNLTPLQKKLAGLSKFLGILAIAIVAAILCIQLLDAFVFHYNSNLEPVSVVIDKFMFAISLAVAAVPEGLVAVVTIVLAIGVQKMVKANTIVRKLPSVETLGSVSVVCSDKTGTLTQNKMTVVKTYVNNHFIDKEKFNSELNLLASGMSLCSNATIDNGVFGDPTEVALVEFAHVLNINKNELETKYPRIDELPFDSVRKMMSTQHNFNGRKVVFTKGAVDQILKNVSRILINGKSREITEQDKKDIMKASDKMAVNALRVLALAYKEDNVVSENHLIFVGLVGMIDPARPEARSAVDLFKRAGITTIMITGDHKTTALSIARDLGIAEDEKQCLSGDEIDKLSPEELQKYVGFVRVFARVSPENKVSIVEAIKANGNIVAMTGDGVNDAPSLRKADIGIAMGITGTDVAKSAADMILVDDNFASIEKAVEEGRGIYANIKKTVLFLMSSNISEVLSMLVVAILSLFVVRYSIPEPLIAIHILFVNLVTDSLPAIALGSDGKAKNIMDDKPRDSKESLFANGGLAISFGYGIAIALITLIAFFWTPIFCCGSITFDLNEIALRLAEYDNVLLISQTMAFSTLAISELFHMLGMTNIKKSFVHNFKGKNWLLLVAFVVGVGLQLFIVMTPGVNTVFKCHPLTWQWIVVFSLSLLPLVIHEVIVFILWLKKKIKKT